MSTGNLNILLVEDNPGDARLLREGLKEAGERQFVLTHAETLAHALDRLAETKFDVGVLDLALPDAHGLEVVRRVRLAAPEVPLLVLSAVSDEGLAVESLHEGAQDYLVKGEVGGGSLWRALRYAMERHQVQLRLVNLSLVDDLTGLSNRKGFLSLASQHAKIAHRNGTSFLVGFIDVDEMKQINDAFGHREGNHALVETADVLRDSFRQSDILARYGGDEFAVVISDAAHECVATVIERVQGKVQGRNAQPGRRYHLSLSLGLVCSDAIDVPEIAQLLDEADAAMYRDKQDRRRARSCQPV
jgi:diguanylate cyclase (GGDEF)-like protein